jgi:hypothetical protein
MFDIFVCVYGWDYTDETYFNGKGNLQFAQSIWNRYVDYPFDPHIENVRSWESRGGRSNIRIRPIRPV